MVQRIEVAIIVATSSSQTRNMASDQFTRDITHPPVKKHRPLILLAATGRCLLQTTGGVPPARQAHGEHRALGSLATVLCTEGSPRLP